MTTKPSLTVLLPAMIALPMAVVRFVTGTIGSRLYGFQGEITNNNYSKAVSYLAYKWVQSLVNTYEKR